MSAFPTEVMTFKLTEHQINTATIKDNPKASK